MSKINLKEIEQGDVFSEQSHYKFLRTEGTAYVFNHLATGSEVKLDGKYVEDLLQTADQYEKEVEVGKEDKVWTAAQITKAVKDGDLATDHKVREGDVKQVGIRTIWANIHSNQVFTVAFNKQIKDKTKKALAEEKQKQLEEAVKVIEAAKTGKKSISIAAQEAIKKIQENPILPTEPVEERVLRGYKIQFSSITGHYDVVDMDIEQGMNVRKVNVSEINFLVYNNIKYIVK